MSEINNLLKTIGRVLLETAIENLEETKIKRTENQPSTDLVIRSTPPVKEDVDGNLYGSVYKSDGTSLFLDNGENNGNNYPLYYGSIVDSDGNWILKNIDGSTSALKVNELQGGLQGGVSGLVKSYTKDLSTIIPDNTDYQTVLDPGYYYENDDQLTYSANYVRTAKYWGDVWSNNFNSSDTPVQLIDSNDKSGNFPGGITGNVSGNADTATFADEDAIDLEDKQTINTRLKNLEEITNQETIGVPKGTIVMWSGDINDIPSGWKLCNGDNTDENTIGVNIPNLSGKFVVGYNADDDDFDTIKKVGGEKSVTLSVDEMPAHNHEYIDARTSGEVGKSASGESQSQRGYAETTNTGGGKSHNNLPPYYVIAYIMYVGI